MCGQPGYTIRSTSVTHGWRASRRRGRDANTNLTIDFGLVLNLSLGDLVWSDANNNGLVDGGEPGVDAISVRLYTRGTLLATTTTAGGGLYRFVNLPAGDYIVEIAPPTGACSSSGTVGSGTGPVASEGNPGQPPGP